MKEIIATCMKLVIIILISTRVIYGDGAHQYDHYLLNCGHSAGGVSNLDGQNWSSDENTAFSSLSSSTSAVTSKLAPNVPSIPFTTARIFKSNFTYKFPVSSGPKFLRLFFYNSFYTTDFNSSLNTSYLFISVQANNHLLLRNFTAQPNTTSAFVIKEYHVTVPSGESSLTLTFSPTPPTTYAFVNGIELVSVPTGLYTSTKPVLNVDSPSELFRLPESAALETAYRLNVGGREIDAITDGEVSGMYRKWNNDDPHTFLFKGQVAGTTYSIKYTEQVPNYAAPKEVYRTERHLGYDHVNLNLTWRLKVDPGFHYMVRLHWCELALDVNPTNNRVFAVYLNNLMAESGADVMLWTANQRHVPFYKDYVVFVGAGEQLSIALHPSTSISQSYNEVLLNGMEILKINKPDGSLDAPQGTPSKLATKPPKGSKFHHSIVVGAIFSGTFFTSLVVCILLLRHMRAIKQSKNGGTRINTNRLILPSFELVSKNKTSMPSYVCVRFSLSKIKLATNGFNEDLIIGHGGFGNVYRATILDGTKGLPIKAAIKRLNPSSKQGAHEFMTEIEMLSKIRHIHLVSLIGYCDDSGEMILVYDFMEKGTLRDHLCDTNNPPLSWDLRLSICLGAAKGLHYLHAGVSHTIIHRDVKSTNILLDENWVPKISDFGLSKLGPIGGDLHVSTAIKESFGYMDPQYYMLQQLTDKSDVYSFGVVLFEVLCGRAAVNLDMPSEQVNLAMWARGYQQRGDVEEILDPFIKDEITPACLSKFGEIAERCVRDHRTERPSMADVVWSLELAIELQQQTEVMSSNCNVLSDGKIGSLSVSEFTSLDESQVPLPQIPTSTSHAECMIKMNP